MNVVLCRFFFFLLLLCIVVLQLTTAALWLLTLTDRWDGVDRPGAALSSSNWRSMWRYNKRRGEPTFQWEKSCVAISRALLDALLAFPVLRYHREKKDGGKTDLL